MLGGEATESRPIVMSLDVISGLAVIGIALLFFRFTIDQHRTLSLTYLGLKFVEGAVMIGAGILFLFDDTNSLRGPIYATVQLYAFGLSAFVFYVLLYKSRLVPRFIAVWGFVAIGALGVKTVLGFAGIQSIYIDGTLVLIITNEFFLAIWLMVRGFSERASD